MQYTVRPVGANIVIINDIYIQSLDDFIQRLRDDNETLKKQKSQGYSGE